MGFLRTYVISAGIEKLHDGRIKATEMYFTVFSFLRPSDSLRRQNHSGLPFPLYEAGSAYNIPLGL
jgi:hypothetical protein